MKKKLVLTCSGGETSMMMVIWCLNNLQDEYDIVVIFVNTGQEEDATLEFVHKCQEYYKIPIHWIEASVYHTQRKSTGYKVVRYETATRKNDWKNRNDTPFEEIIKKYNIPNHSRLHCTRELKMNPIKAFAIDYWADFEFNKEYIHPVNLDITNKLLKLCKRKGNKRLGFYQYMLYHAKNRYKEERYKFHSKYKADYYLALGIRRDEMDRQNQNAEKLRLLYPLIRKDMQPMTKKHINFWWSQQPFRLNLKGYQGNCVTCYKKSNNKLYQIAKEQPEAFDFFDKMEQVYGNLEGKIPQKIDVQYWDEDNQEFYTKSVLETLSPEEYKNTFFRSFRSAKDIVEESKSFTKDVVDDHVETESCEIFSNCGDLE